MNLNKKMPSETADNIERLMREAESLIDRCKKDIDSAREDVDYMLRHPDDGALPRFEDIIDQCVKAINEEPEVANFFLGIYRSDGYYH